MKTSTRFTATLVAVAAVLGFGATALLLWSPWAIAAAATAARRYLRIGLPLVSFGPALVTDFWPSVFGTPPNDCAQAFSRDRKGRNQGNS